MDNEQGKLRYPRFFPEVRKKIKEAQERKFKEAEEKFLAALEKNLKVKAKLPKLKDKKSLVLLEKRSNIPIYEDYREGNDRSVLYKLERAADRDDENEIGVFLRYQKVHYNSTGGGSEHTHLTGQAYYIRLTPDAQHVIEVRSRGVNSKHFSDNITMEGEVKGLAGHAYDWLDANVKELFFFGSQIKALERATELLGYTPDFRGGQLKHHFLE